MSGKYIAIAGNVGSGKSSLTEFLCKHFGLKPFYEPNDINPYLDDFYKNMNKWAFHSQIHFLTHKFRIHQELEKCGETVIQDRTIYEDAEIFATNLYRSGNMDKRDYDTYMELYNIILGVLRPPDLMISLDCSFKSIKKRIMKRGRDSEKGVNSKYFKSLDKLYKEWLDGYNLSPVIRISTEKYDYLEDFITRQDLLDQIKDYI